MQGAAWLTPHKAHRMQEVNEEVSLSPLQRWRSIGLVCRSVGMASESQEPCMGAGT